jgi:tetratricopeptide (TPR) repeat protein
MHISLRSRLCSVLSGHVLCLLILMAVPASGLPLPQVPPVASSGVVVKAVAAGSAAEKAGLRVGDTLIQVAGRSLTSPFAVLAALENRGSAPIMVKGQRGTMALEAQLTAGDIGLQVRPALSSQVLSLYETGERQVQAGQWMAAVSPWSVAVKAAEAAGDRAGAGWLCWRLGELYTQREQWSQAYRWQRHAWEMVKNGGDTAAQGSVLQRLGLSDNVVRQYNLMQLPPTLNWYEQARQVDARTGYRVWYAECLIGEAGATLNNVWYLSHPHEAQARAEERLKQAISILQELAPVSRDMADCLDNQGFLADNQGDRIRARAYYHQALDMYQKAVPDSPQMALSLLHIGMTEENHDLAHEYDQRALDIFEKQAPDSLSVAMALNNLGTDSSISKKEKLKYYLRALAIFRKQAPDSLGMATLLANVAGNGNDPAQNKSYYLSALAIAQRFPLSGPLANVLYSLGVYSYIRGRLSDADQYAQRAAAVFRKIEPASPTLFMCFDLLGTIAYNRDDLEQARTYFEAEASVRQRQEPNAADTASSLSR